MSVVEIMLLYYNLKPIFKMKILYRPKQFYQYILLQQISLKVTAANYCTTQIYIIELAYSLLCLG